MSGVAGLTPVTRAHAHAPRRSSDSMSPVQTGYEYRGMLASTWDLLRGDYSTWPDRPFYRAIIERSGQPALDVGCGTGRLLLDSLQAGIDIDGVDNSPEMLDICREKAASLGLDVSGRLFQQTMERLDLPRRYGTVLVPSSSIQLLTDPADAAEAMRRFLGHLLPGGTLVMSVMDLFGGKTAPQGEWTQWRLHAERQRDDGATVRRYTRSQFDHGQRVVDEQSRFELWRGDEKIGEELHERSPTRSYDQASARQLCLDAGFVDVRLTAGFTDGPATPDDGLFCVIARRPVASSG